MNPFLTTTAAGTIPELLTRRLERERRANDRFPIERELRYKVLSKRNEESGAGTTVNMSSGGLLFQTGKMLIPGKRVELAISWPAQLNNTCALKLVARGRIVRSHGGQTAVQIQQYEFRTVGVHGLSV